MLVILALMCCGIISTESADLHIGAFYPLSAAFSSWGAGTLPAAKLAVRHMNQDPSVLHNYTLKLINADTQGSPGVATRELIRMLQNPPTKIMLLGPFPSHLAQAVAQTARWWNLVQVSPAAFTPALSDRSTYPLFFRTRASLTTFNPARIALLSAFNWTRVAIIARHTNYFIQTVDMLLTDLRESGIRSVTSEVYQTESQPVIEITRIKELDARVIFVFAYEEHARKIFCQAHKHGLTGDRYVWIMHYGNDPRWMDKATEDGQCTVSEIQEAAAGHLVTRDVTTRDDNQHAMSGQSVDGFLDEYNELCLQLNTTPAEFYAPLTYDAVWSIGLALNASLPRLSQFGGPENFSYESTFISDIIMDEMYRLSFEGLSGHIAFSSTGNIASLKTKIQQLQDGVYKTLGYHNSMENDLVLSKQPMWTGGRIPFDRMQVREVAVPISKVPRYLMMTLSIAGVGVSLLFLHFNISNRNTKLIRMSSPNLNSVIILGCILSFLSVILYGVDGEKLRTFTAACHMRMMFLAIGFSLGFGGLFAKTWRVFKIFTNKAAKKIVISDAHLFIMVGSFVASDLVIFILWFSIDPIHLAILEGEKVIDSDDIDYYVLPVKTMCASRYGYLIQLPFFFTKGILLLFGAFLSWQTHKVSIPALNDSKAIGIAVYNVAVMCCLGVPASFVFPAFNVNVRYGVISSCILIATMLTQCIVFIPKIRMLNSGKVDDLTNTSMQATLSVKPADHASKATANTTLCALCKARVEDKETKPGSSVSRNHIKTTT